MNEPQPISDAYIAGFFDGEGCVFIARKGQADVHSGRVVFSNTNHDLLAEIQQALGGVGTLHKAHPGSETQSQVWVLICAEAASQVVLERLMPYLRLKRREAETMLDFLDHKRLYPMGRGKHKRDRETRRRIWKSREFYARSLQMYKGRFQCTKHKAKNVRWWGKPLDEAFDASYHGWHASDAELRLLPT